MEWRCFSATIAGGAADAPDSLAAPLTETAAPAIGDWATRHSCARKTAPRHFNMVYGVDPARYPSEARARRAWRMIVGGDGALADVAAETAYADQAYMIRSVKALTGHTPGKWRIWRRPGSHLFNTCGMLRGDEAQDLCNPPTARSSTIRDSASGFGRQQVDPFHMAAAQHSMPSSGTSSMSG